MANGIEDLREKNEIDSDDMNGTAGSASKKSAKHKSRYDSWRVFQGREDAEMLQEKSAHWSSRKDACGDYDSWDD
ncbi:MAG: hypothetical protein K5640_08080 [Treponema sp.]|nr:hypothetical protein [Treponema sp.]